MDLLLIAATLTFPQLVALPLNYLGIPLESLPDWQLLLWLGGMMLPMLGLGFAWNQRRWLWATAIGIGIMIPLFTTFFTPTGSGISGLASSLDYWLDQQSVQRGSQPEYFYLIQLLVYEFLPIFGVILAIPLSLIDTLRKPRDSGQGGESQLPGANFPFILFLAFFIITANLAYAVAGEKMPWLTVHIALPMILLSGWSIGWVLNRLDFKKIFSGQNLLFILLLVLLSMAVIRLGSATIFPPEAGLQPEVESAAHELGRYFSYAIVIILAAIVFVMAVTRRLTGIGGLVFVLLVGALFLQTARASFRAAFVKYDEATEFLVYAHSGSGPKQALVQIQELSLRINGDLSLGVAYDDITTYPFWWYFRDHGGSFFYGDRPTRQLLDYPLIVAGDGNWARVEGLLRDRYYQYEYTRIWWPMEEYRNLTWERIHNALTSPEYRQALWDIWFERDFSDYGALIGQPLTLQDWALEQDMKLYIRKDIANLLWSQGGEASIYQFEDPYADAMRPVDPLFTVGGFGQAEGQFSGPRDIALAPDGSYYVADTFNHRIQHISQAGEVLHTWGAFSPAGIEPRPPGTFNEPWGIAVGPDGTVYVADTWNNRIQHFEADGEFIELWDEVDFSEAETYFYGPREVVVDDQGRVYVADTGNKRIVVFNADGEALAVIGGPGSELGRLEEPVGLALGVQGELYVADTWNGRVQFFIEDIQDIFRADFEVRLEAWFGQSLDNKPYIAAGPGGQFCITDPVVARVLCFDRSGRILLGWDTGTDDTPVMMLPVGIEIDSSCRVWVMDAGLNQVIVFDPGLCPES
jgi:streptogramin lyase